ncbi:CLUMA_CG004780, isoform A [Clunio marinus]|uniref:CLUMA_CG004780, isoform A n=1 Tax=Clunio marinus TaxID=568069 RepID=A0A1J1HUQ0_9DIPT|nr:CLUMA_CG004780, isoform A [Clunio marinus]
MAKVEGRLEILKDKVRISTLIIISNNRYGQRIFVRIRTQTEICIKLSKLLKKKNIVKKFPLVRIQPSESQSIHKLGMVTMYNDEAPNYNNFININTWHWCSMLMEQSTIARTLNGS